MSNSKNLSLATLTTQLQEAVSQFQLPTPLGFGQCIAPVMAVAHFAEGEWSDVELVPYAPLTLDPACKSLHYGQLIFEGMKAYPLADGGVGLFRPQLNAKRLNASARRMAMPELPESLFLGAVTSLVHHIQTLVPTGSGESLYLRPIMLATDVGLSLKPATTYKFLVIASPSGGYFGTSRITALIEREDCRAAPGGTGAYKVAGNYGASIRADIKAARLNCQQTLWLDAVHKHFIEEFSGMNFFAVVDGELWTPPISDTILDGITRDSVIHLARHHGVLIRETPIAIDDLVAAIKGHDCTEIFACGTAAVVSPVHALAETDGTQYELSKVPKDQSLSLKLREALVAMQTGLLMAPGDWLYRVGGH